MKSTEAVVYDQPIGWEGFSGSGDWTFGEPILADNGHRLMRPARTSRPGAGLALALLLAASSLTSAADPWAEQQRERSQVTVAFAFRPAVRRRLSPAEAKKIALDILYRAESHRRQTAIEEAARGIDWGEIA